MRTNPLLLSITLALLLPMGCAARQVIPPGQIPAATAPSTEEVSVAESYVSGYVDEEGFKKLPPSSKESKRVKALTNKLLVAAGYAPNTFPIYVVDAGDEVHAMAVNSASLVVYKELLVRLPKDGELAVVMAHEVAHILARHAQDTGKEERAAWVSVGSSVLGTVASVATSAAGYHGASGLAGDLTEGTTGIIGHGAIVQKFDRDQEYEADHVGLMLMAKAGFNPEEAPKFWDRAAEIFGSSSGSLAAFLSTHPASADRGDALREHMPLAMEYYRASGSKGKK